MSPRLIAAFAHKYEPSWMLDDLRANLAWVDGFAVLDQSGRPELWSPRHERVRELRVRAAAMGADWCMIVDPDERLERNAEQVIRRVIDGDPTMRYSFPCRELFTPTAYRVDGVWGRKTRRRLFHITDAGPSRTVLDVNLYHLKMIEPENRALRARVFKQENTWDNHTLGFDYLADDSGMVLVDIPPGRGYDPPYRPYRFEVPRELLE